MESAKKPRILVVDDEPGIREFLKDFLEDNGFDVQGASSGGEAKTLMPLDGFDLVLVDNQLGDTTGLTLAREIKQVHDDIPIILITGHASLETAIQAIRMDVDDYLLKPIDTKRLLNTIQRHLAKHRLSDDNKRLLAELQEANRKLKHVDEIKNEFLRVVSHDLRTPLSSLIGYSQILLNNQELTEERRRQFLSTILRQGNHLNRLIGDLLDYEAVQSGRLRVEPQPVDIQAWADEMAATFSPLAAQKEIKMIWRVSPHPARPVEMDPQRMSQVLSNLLGNALKHTPSGGTVVIDVATQKDRLAVEVTDSGEGIPPEDLPRVFDEFFQVNKHVSRREGMGLGLTIALKIVQAHGGHMTAHSTGVGQGTRISFWLPLLAEKT